MPVACMCAYMMVEPTKVKPRFFRSLLSWSDTLVVAGIRDIDNWPDVLAQWSERVREACAAMARGDVRMNRWQSADDARALNLLTRFTELRNER